MAAVAVTWGFHSEPLLRSSRPDHLLTDPRQLLELVAGIRAAG